MKKQLIIPKFKNEDEERDFWASLDISEYLEPSDFHRVVFPNLKPTTRSISIRLPEYVISRVKEQANHLAALSSAHETVYCKRSFPYPLER